MIGHGVGAGVELTLMHLALLGLTRTRRHLNR
jgi:hypothetical protein